MVQHGMYDTRGIKKGRIVTAVLYNKGVVFFYSLVYSVFIKGCVFFFQSCAVFSIFFVQRYIVSIISPISLYA